MSDLQLRDFATGMRLRYPDMTEDAFAIHSKESNALLSQLHASWTAMTAYKEKYWKSQNSDLHLMFMNKVSSCLHEHIGRRLLQDLMKGYLRRVFPKTWRVLERMIGALSAIEILRFLSMLMCNVPITTTQYSTSDSTRESTTMTLLEIEQVQQVEQVHVEQEVEQEFSQDAMIHFAGCSVWEILCEDKVLAKRFHRVVMPLNWTGTWTDMLTSVVDTLVVPQRRRWREREFKSLGKNKQMIAGAKIGDSLYYTGQGCFLSDEKKTRIAYGQQGTFVGKIGNKTKIKVFDSVNIFSNEEVCQPSFKCG